MDIQALTLIGAALAIVTSLLGAVLAVEQLTASYRYRRRADFLRATLESGTLSPSQREIITSVHGETVGRVLAASAVPTWGLWVDLFLIVTPGAYGFMLGRGLLGLKRSVDTETAIVLSIVLVMAFGFCFSGAHHAAKTLRERGRLARSFRRGRSPLRANPINIFTDRRGALLAALMSVGYLVALIGIGGVFASFTSTDWVPFMVFVVGYGMVLAVSFHVRHYVDPRPIRWIHPEPRGRWPKRWLKVRVRVWHRLIPGYLVRIPPAENASDSKLVQDRRAER